MIGQFVSRFVGGLKTWQLLGALLILPSITIAFWFAVLYGYYDNGIEVSPMLKLAMVSVGVLFVLNSLDSLTRLYTENFNISVSHLGFPKYVILNWGVLFGLVLLYQFTELNVEWVGLVVIGIYLIIMALLWRSRKAVKAAL